MFFFNTKGTKLGKTIDFFESNGKLKKRKVKQTYQIDGYEKLLTETITVNEK